MNQLLRDIIKTAQQSVKPLGERCEGCSFEETQYQAFTQLLVADIGEWMRSLGIPHPDHQMSLMLDRYGVAPPVDPERKRFEGWYGPLYSTYALNTWNGTEYSNMDTQLAWESWQAGQRVG